MWIIEGDHNEEDFGRNRVATHGIGHGVYWAIAGFATRTEEFKPVTLAGCATSLRLCCSDRSDAHALCSRVLGLVQAFAVFLFIAFFTANLAVILLQGDPTLQVITSIDSFASQNLHACVLDKSEYISFSARI